MESKPIELDDILSSHVKGEHIRWDGASCYYRGAEIISLFGSVRPTAVWVRNAMPDHRTNWLTVEHPDFFKQFDAAIAHAKKIVDEVIETQFAMDALRDRMLGRS
jgi:hypothetical protein